MHGNAVTIQQVVHRGIKTWSTANLREHSGGDANERVAFMGDAQDGTSTLG